MSERVARRLVLIRHGSTSINESARLLSAVDPGLSERGEKQRDALTEQLSRFAFNSIWTSPALRAIETAQKICDAFDATMHSLPELRERSLGDWEGMSREDIINRREQLALRCDDLTQDWEGCPGVEQDHEVHQRVQTALDTAYASNTVDSLIVSHAGVIKSFVYTALEIPQHRTFAFRITLGGYVTFQWRKGSWELAELWPNPHAAAPAII